MKTSVLAILLALSAVSTACGAAAPEPKADPKAAAAAKAPETKQTEGSTPETKTSEPAAASPSQPPKSWQEVKRLDLFRIDYDSLPSDDGNEGPFAWEDPTDNFLKAELDEIRRLLPGWEPGKVADPVQRMRNLLLVAVVPDSARTSVEPFAPLAVLEYAQKVIPRDDLIKILCWIALHPEEGDHAAAKRVHEAGILIFDDQPREEIVKRTHWYAAKMILRLTN